MSVSFSSLFTHSHVVSNVFDFLSSVEHKLMYFEKCVCVCVCVCVCLCCMDNIFQNIFFCVFSRKKNLDQRDGESIITEFHFWVNYH